MSLFSDAFAATFDAAVAVFGDTCVINSVEYPCIIHELNLTTRVDPDKPGKTIQAGGTVVLKAADWTAAAGAKGTRITVGGATLRVINDPTVGYDSGTLILQLAPVS